MRIVKWIGRLVAVIVVGFAIWLYVAPPDLIRVGSQYSAKIVCSNVFIAGRDPEKVLRVDVQAPGHPLLRIMQVNVDRDQGVVTAGLLGMFGKGRAIFRDGLGCTTVTGGADAAVAPVTQPAPIAVPPEDRLWPEGAKIDLVNNAALNRVLADPVLTGEGMRAVVVVKDGRIIAERYADGFGADTPLLGWSMTKTVTAALAGLRIGDGRLTLDEPVKTFPAWQADGRSAITLADLMGMASDLKWNEDYGAVSDVTRMLYLEPDMAAFAASRNLDTQTPEGISESFEYSTGTTMIIAETVETAGSNPADVLTFARDALFAPLGMAGATLEPDQSGTPVAGSYLYAPARDWARFGQMLLQGGRWQGRQLLPEGFVDWMTEAHPASAGRYGRGHIWKVPQNFSRPGPNVELPDGSFFLGGHDGQSVNIIPSENLVVVRMGLTPSKLNYKVATLVAAVIEATQQ